MTGANEAAYDQVARGIWSPRQPVGESDLAYLVHYATLAANSHNTQPWRFSGTGGRVTIKPDFSRATPAADPDGHHLFASLGCACENLLLAAAAAGQDGRARFEAAGDGRIEIELAGGARGRDPLFDAIRERQCTRALYDDRAVAADELTALERAASLDGCGVILIPDRTQIEQLLALLVSATRAQIEDPAFKRELSTWLRFNGAAALETRDGLYGACAGQPSLPTWLGRILFSIAFRPKAETDKLARQVRSSSGLAVFVSDRDDKRHWVQAGRSYQRFALQATALGLRHAFINQVVEVAATRAALAELLAIGERRPDLVLRYGYGPAMPRSLRRPVEAVIG